MNASKIAIIAALAIPGVGLVATSANAQQVCGGFFSGALCESTYATDTDGDLTNSETTHVIDGVTFPGIAVTENAPKPMLDANGNQMIDSNGNPLYVKTGPFNVDAQAYGNGSTAVGAGSRVGEAILVPQVGEQYTCPNGGTLQGTNCSVPGPNNDYNAVPSSDYKPEHWEVKKAVNNGTAIGSNSSVQHDNSTAIGAGAKSTDTNQVTLGTKDETIRAEGITSQKSKDRQVGPTELVTSDSGGRLATDGGQTFARIGSLEGGLSDAQQAINANTALLSQHSAKLDTLSKGVAIAMSLPDAWIEANKRFSIAGNIGGFDGETAIGFAGALRLDETWSLNAKLGADTSFDEYGWTVGARASW